MSVLFILIGGVKKEKFKVWGCGCRSYNEFSFRYLSLRYF